MSAHAVDFTPVSDTLLRAPLLDHAVELPMLGIRTRFESNSRHVIETIEQAFGGWKAVSCAAEENPLRVRIVVRDGVEGAARPVPVRYIAPDAVRIIAQSSSSVAISDPERRESVAYVTAELAADRDHFRGAMVEATTLALLSHFDRHPLHASAIARDGRAVLLAGASGAGKSTLAHLAHGAGIDVMSEDHVWLQLAPQFQVWGWPGHARLLLPGQTQKQLVPLSGSHRSACFSAHSAVVCVLARGARASLDRIESVEVFEALTRDVAPGFDRFPARHTECARALAEHGGWRLTLSPHPGDALPFLQHMLDPTLA